MAEYNILDYGAIADDSTNNAKAIQKAIDECHENGGGKVIIPGGNIFRSGYLVLKSNVELYLENGATLKATDNIDDLYYNGKPQEELKELNRPTYEMCDYNGAPSMCFIFCNSAENIAITGLGKIDGNEKIFYGKDEKWHIDGYFYPRAPLLYLINVKHLTIKDVTLTGSAFWTTHLIGCKDVLIMGIRILNNLKLANCDGIDPDHCQNVRIIGCHIECADDCIVFKNTEHFMDFGPCENIVVSDCTLISTSAAIKFGSESEDIFKNISVSNCIITRSNRAISLQLRDKGSIENCIFSNINIETRLFSKIHWWGAAEPIAITAVPRNNKTNIGHIRNIVFSNINCDGENGIFIYGDKFVNISDIYFNKINVRLSKKTDWPKDMHDLRPTLGEGLIKDSLRTIYVKNAKNIEFDRCKYTVDDNMEEYVENQNPVYVENAEIIGL